MRFPGSRFAFSDPRAPIKLCAKPELISELWMMAAYKLTYFNNRGFAEVLRFIFAQAGVPYEDRRVGGEEWAKLKPTTPTGQLPILEIEGKTLTGSAPIARFLAGRFGLEGTSDLEKAQLGGMIDYLLDFVPNISSWSAEQNEDKKTAIWDTVRNEHIPKYWGLINKWIEDNTGSVWIFGSNPTYVDFFIYCYTELILAIDPLNQDVFNQFPAILKHRAAVESLPNIAKWIKERPVTQY